MLEEDWADIVDPVTLGVKMLYGVGIRDQRKKSEVRIEINIGKYSEKG